MGLDELTVCLSITRLAQIESSLAEITALLRSPQSPYLSTPMHNNKATSFSVPSWRRCSAPQLQGQTTSSRSPQLQGNSIRAPRRPGSISRSRELTSDVGIDGFPQAEAQAQIAPINVVRQLKNMIAGEKREVGSSASNILDDLMSIGIDPEGNGKFFFERFIQTSNGMLFFPADFSVVKQQHPILFAACLVVGVQTVPSLRSSTLYDSLYTVTRDNLGRAMVNTPVDLHTIHTMLIFCLWNVAKNFRGRYVDNWFLSGSAILHLLLVLDIRALDSSSQVDTSLIADIGAQDALRAWCLASLLHVKHVSLFLLSLLP